VATNEEYGCSVWWVRKKEVERDDYHLLGPPGWGRLRKHIYRAEMKEIPVERKENIL